MKKISILGSTGSIGQSVLSLVDLYPDHFRVVALAANTRVERICQQALKYQPELVALHDVRSAAEVRDHLPGTRVLSGLEGVIDVATHPEADIVAAGITGAAGLLPTYQAILQKKDVALANKETLVMAGELIMSLVKAQKVNLLPVDSEHSALQQCLHGAQKQEVRRLILTASGGPFFSDTRRELDDVTVEEALNHPTWRMGPKISIDSATLMNKGLEVIEAHHLFGVSSDQISIVIHPQSTIHSMVEFIDGTILAQMGITDMRSCLLYAFFYPQRSTSNLPTLDFLSLPPLKFYPPDIDRFPCIRLAYESLEKGQTYPVSLNAANEVAVEHFLKGMIPFSAIPRIIEEVLNKHAPTPVYDLETVLEANHRSRQMAESAAKIWTDR